MITNKISDWMEENELLINHTKTKAMLIGLRPRLKNIQKFDIVLDGQKVERVVKFEYLGVIFDQHMTWQEHVESTGKKVAKRIGFFVSN